MDAAEAITVFLADDNRLVRKGVKALLDLESDIEVVGVAADYDELVAGCVATPQVVVTTSGCRSASSKKASRRPKKFPKRAPGTGIVVLTECDGPEYFVALLSEEAAGYGYLLKDGCPTTGGWRGRIEPASALRSAVAPVPG